MRRHITGVVLAGGKSTRMGQDKALLHYKGKTLIEHIIARLRPYCDEVLVSTNEHDRYGFLGVPLLIDKNKDCGPLGGLEAALAASADLCFVVPCDLPFFSGAIIPFLAAEISKTDACIPTLGGYYEPLVALYDHAILPVVQDALRKKQYRVRVFFDEIKVTFVPEEKIYARHLENVFCNVNTLEDYENILRGKAHE